MTKSAVSLCGTTAVLLALTLASPSAEAGNIVLYDTGVIADNSTLSPRGIADLHYSLLSAPAGASIGSTIIQTTDTYPIAEGPNSQNIGPSAYPTNVGAPEGFYAYATSFTIAPGLNPATAIIGGYVLADDNVSILLNGTFTGVGFTLADQALHPFSLATGSIGGASFVSGENTLEFLVDNTAPGPTTLRVDSLSGSAGPDLLPAPEPSTLVSAGTAILLCALAARRRSRRRVPILRR